MSCSKCHYPNPAPVYVGDAKSQYNERCPICGLLLHQNTEQITLMQGQRAYLDAEIKLYTAKILYLSGLYEKFSSSTRKTATVLGLAKVAKDSLDKRIVTFNGYVAQRTEVQVYLNTLLQRNLDIDEKNSFGM